MPAKGKGGNTVRKVWEIAEPLAQNLGLELWDIRFEKEGANWYLRIFIDKDGGVSIDDCVDMSHALDKPLDDEDPIEQSYCLEVCSPGIERELTRPEHFQQFIGADIMVKLIRPIPEIGKELFGKLAEESKDEFVIENDDGDALTIKKKDTVWVKLDDFD